MKYYPVFLDLRGQRCVVVGEGRLAAEKAAGLVRAGAEVLEVSPQRYHQGVLDSCRLVFDASGDPDLGARVWSDAEAAGILVNVVDRPEQCRFIAPAVVDRDPLLVAISTSGESPFVASRLRARLERQLGWEWGPFVSVVGEVRRRLRRQGVALDDQTRIYRRLLRSPLRSLLRGGRRQQARALVREAEAGGGGARCGRVALVGAGPGDPSLLTMAALEQLAEADVVFHDALVSEQVLALCGPDTRRVAVGKRHQGASTPQEEISHRLIEAARSGLEVVRLKGGDPFVFGRGGEEMQALLEAGVEVIVVPGVSSAIAAPAAAGVPLTLRGVASSMAVVTAQPDLGERLVSLAQAADTLVVLMGLSVLPALVERLRPVLGDDMPLAVVSRATCPDQKVVRTTLGDAVAAARGAGVTPPATIVVGRVVDAVVPAWGAAQPASAGETGSGLSRDPAA